jgi:hypothetical protein
MNLTLEHYRRSSVTTCESFKAALRRVHNPVQLCIYNCALSTVGEPPVGAPWDQNEDSATWILPAHEFAAWLALALIQDGAIEDFLRHLGELPAACCWWDVRIFPCLIVAQVETWAAGYAGGEGLMSVVGAPTYLPFACM